VGRLPSFLEDTFDCPKHSFFYAQQILRGRLPSHLGGHLLQGLHSTPASTPLR
jgi:hypothetical protein